MTTPPLPESELRALETLEQRAIDALVARHVVGFGDRVKMVPGQHAIIADAFPVAVLPYSTTLDYAYDVLTDNFGTGTVQMVNCALEPFGNRERGWTVQIKSPGEEGEAFAPTLAMAMCLAMLKAKGVAMPASEVRG